MDIMFCHRTVINASFLGSVEQGQAYFKERTGSDLALHADLTTVSQNDPLHNGQAQTAATGLLVTRLAGLCWPLLPA